MLDITAAPAPCRTGLNSKAWGDTGDQYTYAEDGRADPGAERAEEHAVTGNQVSGTERRRIVTFKY